MDLGLKFSLGCCEVQMAPKFCWKYIWFCMKIAFEKIKVDQSTTEYINMGGKYGKQCCIWGKIGYISKWEGYVGHLNLNVPGKTLQSVSLSISCMIRLVDWLIHWMNDWLIENAISGHERLRIWKRNLRNWSRMPRQEVERPTIVKR